MFNTTHQVTSNKGAWYFIAHTKNIPVAQKFLFMSNTEIIPHQWPLVYIGVLHDLC